MKITNTTGIPLGLAVWILQDNYDYVKKKNYISATQLMKPIRQIVLAHRVEQVSEFDLLDQIPNALGQALHDSVEKAWTTGATRALKQLGHPQSVIDRLLVNPTDEEVAAVKDPILVYIEQRATKEFEGYIVGGKYDMVAEGIVHDNKSTSAFSWVYGTRDEDFKIQGSIYRWLNPDKITEDFIRINFIFTDWMKSAAKSNPAYPDCRCKAKEVPLMSIEETEKWISNRLALVTKYMDAKEEDIPECTDEELWRSKPVYKYYANPNKTTGRSTKNFDTYAEAEAFKQSKGVGIVLTVESEPKRCAYCNVYEICKQKDKYFPQE